MATHSSILAWRTPWTEDFGGLQSMVSQRAGHDRVTKQQQEQSNYFIETESRMVAANGWAEGAIGELVINERRLSVGKDEKVLAMNSGDGCTTV